MKNKFNACTPILALILFVFAVGQAFADNKVVVVPMFGPDAEIVHGTRIYTPPLAAQATSFFERVTSERSGYWMIKKSVARTSITCATSALATFYLQIDGVPIESSMQYPGGTFVTNATFTGVTETVIPAGTHELEIGMQCLSGSGGGAGALHVGRTTVIVIPK